MCTTGQGVVINVKIPADKHNQHHLSEIISRYQKPCRLRPGLKSPRKLYFLIFLASFVRYLKIITQNSSLPVTLFCFVEVLPVAILKCFS